MDNVSENKKLVEACQRGDLKKVKKCLRNGADIHFEKDDPLHKACENGHLKVVKYLVKNGADIHACDNFSLRMACVVDHFDIVKFLVDEGANVNSTIVEIAKRNSTRCIEEFLEAELKKRQAKAAESDDSESDDSESDDSKSEGVDMKNKCLIMDAGRGDIKRVEKSPHGRKAFHSKFSFPLHEACATGNFEVVKFLVNHGADIHASDDIAVYSAAEHGHMNIVRFLVENGANIEELWEGITRAEIVVSPGMELFLDAKMKQRVAEKGQAEDANHNDSNESDNMKLVEACRSGDITEVTNLVLKGADIHFHVDDPLHAACKNGHLEVVKYLVDKGADIHACFDNALKMACQFSHYDIVKFLIANGADIKEVLGSVIRKEIDVSLGMVSFLEQKMKEMASEKKLHKRPLCNSAKITLDEFITSIYVCRDEDKPEEHRSKRIRIIVTDTDTDEVHVLDADFVKCHGQ